jgi:hypothetical protein
MPLQIKELSFLKGVDHWTPEIGAKLAEALLSIQQAHNNVEAQVNGNSTGGPQPPPKVNGVNVVGQNGHLSVSIQDNNPIYRGISYWVEHSASPHFSNPQIVKMGDSRNITIPVGNQTRYVRVYSSYASSHPSEPVYHGTSTQPTPVNGGGADTGPAFLPSQGSGTGQAGVGLQGPGTQPFRPVVGKPPVR